MSAIRKAFPRLGLTAWLVRVLPLMALLMLALLWPMRAMAETKDINTDKVKGKVSNLDWSFLSVDPDIDVSWDGWLPEITFTIRIRVGGSGDFDLKIQGGSLPAGTQPGDHVTVDTHGIDSVTLVDNIFDGIPKIGIGTAVKAKLIIGATKTVSVKGRFDIAYEIVLSSTNGASMGGRSDIQYTSIVPQNKDEETVVCVGTDVGGEIQVGVFGWGGIEVGPIAKLDLSLTDNGMASATLKKDEWYDLLYQKDDVNELHTCTQYGKAGCVSGRMVNTIEHSGGAHIRVKIPIIDYEIYSYDWTKPKYREVNKDTIFHQSLTWNEPLKEKTECDHFLYKVPVYVWLDEEHTKPIDDIFVKNRDRTEGDAVAARFDRGTTGKNPYLGAGRVNLYLPYKQGKYTIKSDTSGTKFSSWSGEAEMPENMVKGANKPVHIVLKSTATRTLSVEKKWDIDFENKDRPESIEVLLQAQYYNTGRFSWVGVEKATLSADNNWTHTFKAVPKSELNDKGESVDIKYRVRELKQASEGAMPDIDDLDRLFPEDIADVIPDADGIYNPDHGAFAEASKRVVPARWDLDNTHVWEVLKKTVTDYNTLWNIQPSLTWLATLGKMAFFPKPTVSYKVGSYTTIVGENVEEHETKYDVDYKEENDKTTITNTAITETAIYKRWILPDGQTQPPDEVWVMLGYRLKEEYRQYIGSEAAEKFLGLWLPVWRPVDGDIASIFTALASATDVEWLKYLDYLITLDIKGSGNLSFAIARIQKPEDDLHNPLTDWRARFKTKKYGWFMFPGMPVEYQAMELSSAVITDVLKYLTGLDIPISMIINPHQLYLTVPGKPIKIPFIDKDWELTANILNTWYNPDSEDDKVIGGTKAWAGDMEEDRPEYLDIVVKWGDRGEIGRSRLRKEDFEGQKTWVWSLKQSQVTAPGVILNPDSDYTITEEYPPNYAHRDNYILSTDGYNLVNTWVKDKTPKIVIRKTLVHSGLTEDRTFSFNLKDDAGNPLNATPYVITMHGEGTETLTLTDITKEKIAGKDIAKFRVEEVNPSGEYEVSYAGPEITTDADGNPVYTFTVTNTCETPHYAIQVLWKGDAEAERPDNVDLMLTDHSFKITKEEGWKQFFNPSWQPRPTKEDAESYLRYFKEDPIPSGYFPTYDVIFEGDVIIWRVTNTKVGPVTVRGQVKWDDDGDAGEKRPNSVSVSIASSALGVVKTFPEVTAANNWKWEVTGLPETDEEGNRVSYYVTETTTGYDEHGERTVVPGVEGYTTEYETPVYNEEEKTWTCDLTNSTHKVHYSVHKIWDDQEDRAGLRPEEVTVRVKVKGVIPEDGPTAILNQENGWNAAFVLPKGAMYSVIEEEPTGYRAAYETNDGDDGNPDYVRTTITNSVVELIDIPVSKVWVGDADRTKVRPESVNVRLVKRKTGEAGLNQEDSDQDDSDPDSFVRELTLRASEVEDENWKGVFLNVLKLDPAEGEDYTIEELSVPGYVSAVAGNAETGFTVTNTFNNKMNIRVKKEWAELTGKDFNPSDRPNQVTFALKRNGVVIEGYENQTLQPSENPEQNWQVIYANMDAYDAEGNSYTYSVEETVPAGYTAEYEQNKTANRLELAILNKYNRRSVSFKKTWDDGTEEGASHVHPEVHVFLTKDGQLDPDHQKTIQPGEAGQEFTFDNLDIYESDGSVIEYGVTEYPVPPDYACYITGSMAEGFILRNVREESRTVNITVRKVWDTKEGSNPETVTVHLIKKKTGEIVKSISLPNKEAEGESVWTYTFTGLPQTEFSEYGLAVPIEYTVEEDAVPGYTTVITGNQTDGFTITNTQDVLNEIKVTKTWDDHGNERKRPSTGITLHLYKGNTRYDDHVTITRTDGPSEPDDYTWEYTIKPRADSVLPVYENGVKVEYSIAEDRVPGYRAPVIGGDAESGFTVLNRYNIQLQNIMVVKDWNGADEAHPNAVTVTLQSDRETEGDFRPVGTKEITAELFWKNMFENQILVDGGREIHYRLIEEVPEGYEHPFIIDNGDEFRIENWKRSPITVKIQKEWVGDTPADRPDSLTVRLKIGESIVRTATLTAAEGWMVTLTDLPILGSGRTGAIPFTVEEDGPGGYTATVTGGADSTGLNYLYTIRNEKDPVPTPTPGRISPYSYRFSFTKRWSGGTGDSIEWTLYNARGGVVHKKFNKKVISETEWVYEGWFEGAVDDYYLIEEAPPGFRVRYENIGIHADVTDRLYNWGRIINYRIPKTGDQAENPALWIGCVLLGLAGLLGILVRRFVRRRDGSGER